eukprot:3933663-Ditylum_brightwellii.AAC.1
MQTENKALAVNNTAKVALLENDPSIKDLVAILYYDYKPVCFLTTALKNVAWTQVKKRFTIQQWEGCIQ